VVATNRWAGSRAAVNSAQPGAGLEGSVPFLDPGLVDRQHRGGMGAGHRLDPHACAGDEHG